MKRAVYVGMIFLSVMMIFAAAEMLPQIVIRYNDRERNNQIILEEDVAAAGKIADEVRKIYAHTPDLLEQFNNHYNCNNKKP